LAQVGLGRANVNLNLLSEAEQVYEKALTAGLRVDMSKAIL